jgi:uncharacterized protein YpmB
MTKKKRILLFGSIIAALVIVAGVVAWLIFANQPSEVMNDPSNEGQVVQEATDLPPVDPKASALVDEAYAAQAKGDYDTGIKKLEEAKAIYVGEDIEMYVGDIDMQIGIFKEQQAFQASLQAENQAPALGQTNQ